jgi:hypothetical protein
MRTRTLGRRQVSAIGLGGTPMSVEDRPDQARSIATVHAALDAGITLIDTADAYHLGSDEVDHYEVGHNETLIAAALASYGGDTSALRRNDGRTGRARQRGRDPDGRGAGPVAHRAIPGASRPQASPTPPQAAGLDLAPEELQAPTAIPAAD